MILILTALCVCLSWAQLTGEIVDFQLVQADLTNGEETTYTINFQPIGAIPAKGTIKIGWPDQVQVTENFSCQVNRLFAD